VLLARLVDGDHAQLGDAACVEIERLEAETNLREVRIRLPSDVPHLVIATPGGEHQGRRAGGAQYDSHLDPPAKFFAPGRCGSGPRRRRPRPPPPRRAGAPCSAFSLVTRSAPICRRTLSPRGSP